MIVMVQYVDKSAIETEIKRLIDCCYKMCAGDLDFLQKAYPEHYYSIETYKEILSFLDTLEVKEVDLEKEIDGYMTKKWEGIEEDKRFYDMMKNNLRDIAKHFFELGLKAAQKGKDV